ncbi:uncharacterized protein [Typha angustifolia]|uniref:uncharacterized protein n=1 Tax=Typha angustifolia TaxID=59011 RepID=UPI003C2F14D3
MVKAINILRRSLHSFFKNYHPAASTAAFLALPFSAAALFSQSLAVSSSAVHSKISSRLWLLFDAAGFPAASQFFLLLNSKLSQTILSSISTLPFAFTFLLLAKASVFQIVRDFPPCKRSSPSFVSALHLYSSLVKTQIFNSFAILSANAAVFSLLFLAFNTMEVVHLLSKNSILVLSVAGVIVYSVVLANAMVACNLAIVVSGIERCGGYLAFVKALMLIRGRTATAITLSLPANLGIAAVESLFQFRVMRSYKLHGGFGMMVSWEGLLIAYMYSLVIVLDTIITCMLYKSCKAREGNWQGNDEEKGALQA